MTRKTAIDARGYIDISAYLALGFRPGMLVEIIKTSAGTLIVRLDDDVPTYAARFEPIVYKVGARKVLPKRTRP